MSRQAVPQRGATATPAETSIEQRIVEHLEAANAPLTSTALRKL